MDVQQGRTWVGRRIFKEGIEEADELSRHNAQRRGGDAERARAVSRACVWREGMALHVQDYND